MFDGILGYIIGGAVIGVLARFLKPGSDPMGWIMTILLGIVGAVLGGYLGRALGLYGPEDAAGFLMSLVGAIVLLAIYRLAVRRRTV